MKTIKSTLYAFMLVVSISFSAQSQDKGVTLDFANAEANMQLLQEYVKTFNQGDAAKLNSFFADEAVIFGLDGGNDSISKREHLERYTANFKANTLKVSDDVYLPVMTNENAAVAPGEYTFSWGDVSSTNKTTGKSAKVGYHVVALIDNGKITRMWHYYDTLPFAIKEDYELVKKTK